MADAAEELAQLLLVQHNGTGQGKVRGYGRSSGLDFLQLLSNFPGYSFCIKSAEIILLLQLHTLFFPIVSGDRLYHGIVAHLGLVDAPAVANGVSVAIDEDFNRVEVCIF